MSQDTSGLEQAMAGARFRDYAPNLLTIENENGELVPFELNEAQLILEDEVERQQALGRPVRILVLKGRQQGVSTWAQGRKAHRSFTRRTRGLTVGHQLAAVHELWGKLDRFHRGLAAGEAALELAKAGIVLQPPLEPGMGEKGRRTVFADPLGSVCRYDSAADPQSVGRGITVQFAHLTEIPQWSKPDETMQAVLATISDNPDTMVLVETTAKGASGWFYETWCSAMADVMRGVEPEFVPIFIEWWRTKRYARKRRSGEPKLSPREVEFRDKYDLRDEQVYWYRDQRRKYGERVAEEFPCTWQEAFLSSGLPFFRREIMADYRLAVENPDILRTGQWIVDEHGYGHWNERPGAPTTVFAEPVEHHRYVVGADFASGRAGDRSAIVVIDATTREVVATHSSMLDPDRVLDEAYCLAQVYNGALIVPERSGIGQVLVDRLVNEMGPNRTGYTNVYREYDPVAVKHHGGSRYGWATSNRNRQWLLEELARHIHEKRLSIPCPEVVKELGTFVYTDETGDRAEAGDDALDDLVMALAFAVRGLSYLPPATTSATTDLRSPAERRAHISSATGY